MYIYELLHGVRVQSAVNDVSKLFLLLVSARYICDKTYIPALYCRHKIARYITCCDHCDLKAAGTETKKESRLITFAV